MERKRISNTTGWLLREPVPKEGEIQMRNDKMIDELAVCKSLTEVAEIALGNKGYFEDALPVIDLLGIVQERLETCIASLKEAYKEQVEK